MTTTFLHIKSKETVLVTILVASLVAIASFFAYVDNQSKVWRASATEDYYNRFGACSLFSILLPGKSETEVLELLGSPESRGYGICGIVSGERDILRYSLNPKGNTGRMCYTFVVRMNKGRVVEAKIEPWCS